MVPSIQVPPFFISYLYNHSMMLPLKINAGPYKVTRLTARIDSNAWAPTKPTVRSIIIGSAIRR